MSTVRPPSVPVDDLSCAEGPVPMPPTDPAWMPPEPPPPQPVGEDVVAPYYPGSDVRVVNPRDEFGRFVKGNPGGPGNPFARRTAALRQAMAAAVTAEDMYRIALVFKAKALAGDLAAAKFIATYVVGRPAAAADPDRLDLDEFALYKEEAANERAVPEAMGATAAGLACRLVSVTRPAKMSRLSRQMATALETGVVPGEEPAAGGQEEAVREGTVESAPEPTAVPRAERSRPRPTHPAPERNDGSRTVPHERLESGKRVGCSTRDGGKPGRAGGPGDGPLPNGDNGPRPADHPSPDGKNGSGRHRGGGRG
jgi:hypothetical protein